MMTIHRLGAGDGYRYLTDSVAKGDGVGVGQSLSDYYQATGNPPGRWMGAGADILGVAGEVTTGQMHNLYGLGLHPETGVPLGRRYQLFKTVQERVRDRLDAAEKARVELTGEQVAAIEHEEMGKGEKQAVAGFDHVFSPVKSVSLAWALAEDPWVSEQVEAAHHASVQHVLTWMERDVVFARTGAAGIAQVDVAGVAAACFDHRTSRAGDPDLHTHAVISNKVLALLPDGQTRWLTADSQSLHKAAVAASERYNRVLEDELGRRLGWRFEPREDQEKEASTAIRELVGVPLTLIRGFSQRRNDIKKRHDKLIERYYAEHGHNPPKDVQYELAQQATLTERPAKELAETVGEERARWAGQAEDLVGGKQWRRVQKALRPQPLVGVLTGRDIDDDALRELAWSALEDVTDRRSTWTLRHLQAGVLRATRDLTFASPEARALVVDQVVSAVLGGDPAFSDSVRLDPQEVVAAPPELRRQGGESVFVPHGSARFTTQRQLEAEERLLVHARRDDAPRVAAEVVAEVAREAEATPTPLTGDQLAAVTALATSGHGVGLMIGPAGTGKTTTMRALVRAWQSQARPGQDLAAWAKAPQVHGLAPTAVAAAVLKAETGMSKTNTLHRWKFEKGSGDDGGFAAGDLVVVDEAGMVGTSRLLEVIETAAHVGAKVVLVGDYRQLGAIESGGALRLLATDAPHAVAELSSVWRFGDKGPDGSWTVRQWEADASLQVRRGEAIGLEPYFEAGRVTSGVLAVQVDQLYNRWLVDKAAGRTAVMIAAANDVVAELGARARADRVAAGLVEPDGVLLSDGNRGGVGDVVVTRKNNRLMRAGAEFVKNGDLWNVLERHRDGSLLVQHVTHGGRVELPEDYVAESVEQGYAMTVHRTQGSTVDSAHVLVDGTYSRELLYVAMTRGRRENLLHVVTDHVLEPELERPADPDRLARAVLADVLRKEDGDRSATETQREAWAAADSLRTLLPRYRYAAELHAGSRAKDVLAAAVLASDAELTVASAGWPALAERIDLLEERGVDVARELSASVTERGLSGATDLAAVLHSRLGPVTLASRPAGGDWLPAAPAGDAPLPTYLRELRETMDTRARSLGIAAAVERPSWMAGLPDPVAGDYDRWEQLVGRVAAYREAYDVHGQDPLGPMAEEPRQAEARAHLRAAIGEAERAVPTSPGEVQRRLEAARKRVRIASADCQEAHRAAERQRPEVDGIARLETAEALLERLQVAEVAAEELEAEVYLATQVAGDLARARVQAEDAGWGGRRAAQARVDQLASEQEQARERVAEATRRATEAQRGLPAAAARAAARADAERTVADADRIREEAANVDQVAAEQMEQRLRGVDAALAAAHQELASAQALARASGLDAERVSTGDEELQRNDREAGRDRER